MKTLLVLAVSVLAIINAVSEFKFHKQRGSFPGVFIKNMIE